MAQQTKGCLSPWPVSGSRSHNALLQLPLRGGARPHGNAAAPSPGADDAIVHVEEHEERAARCTGWAAPQSGDEQACACWSTDEAQAVGLPPCSPPRLTHHPPPLQPHLSFPLLKVLHDGRGCERTAASRGGAGWRGELRAVQVPVCRDPRGALPAPQPRLSCMRRHAQGLLYRSRARMG